MQPIYTYATGQDFSQQSQQQQQQVYYQMAPTHAVFQNQGGYPQTVQVYATTPQQPFQNQNQNKNYNNQRRQNNNYNKGGNNYYGNNNYNNNYNNQNRYPQDQFGSNQSIDFDGNKSKKPFLYKTKLCPFTLEGKVCRKGEKCQFAHSQAD